MSCSPNVKSLTTYAHSDPKDLWNTDKESMSENILLRSCRAHPRLDIQYSGDILNEALIALEDIHMSINKKKKSQLVGAIFTGT